MGSEHKAVKTELVTHVRDLEVAGSFFIETATVMPGGLKGGLKALGEYYLVLAVTLTRGNVSESELLRVERCTSELVSLKSTQPVVQLCIRIAKQILQDMKNL